MQTGKLRLRDPQGADCTRKPSPSAYCVQRAVGRGGSGSSHCSSPLPPPPSPAGPLPRPGRKWEKWTGKKSWAEPTPPHSPPSPLPSHADPCGNEPRDLSVRCRVSVPPSGPQLGGGTRKAGKTTAQPAPSQPLPPLRPWRSGQRRLLYIIAGGQVGCFIYRPGSPADPSRQPKARPQVPSAAGQTEARGGPASGPQSPPLAPHPPPAARAAATHARVGPRSAHSPPRPRCHPATPQASGAKPAPPPAPASAWRLGACLSGVPHPLHPGGPLPPRPGELWGQISWQAGTAPRSGAERSEEGGRAGGGLDPPST